LATLRNVGESQAKTKFLICETRVRGYSSHCLESQSLDKTISTGRTIDDGKSRIGSLDAIRAWAFLCLVPVVVQSYALVTTSGNVSLSSPLSGADGVIWILLQIFCADIGFILLVVAFGAGLKLHTQRQNVRPQKGRAQQRRRMKAFIAVGILLFALLGADPTFIALGLIGILSHRFIKWHNRKQLVLGTACIVVTAFMFAALAEILSLRAPDLMMEYGLSEMRLPIRIKPEFLALAQSGWTEQFLARLQPNILAVNGAVAGQMTLIGLGLALLGAAAMDRGLLTGGLPASRYVMMIAVGLGLGVPLSLVGILTAVSQAWEPPFLMGFGGLLKGIGSLLLTAAFASFVILVFKRGWFRRGRRMLERLGRSTLTWSILGLFFLAFYHHGYGLGHAGSGDRIAMIQFVALIWILIGVTSYFWFKYFHYGPFEWALRYWANETRPPLARLDKIFAP